MTSAPTRPFVTPAQLSLEVAAYVRELILAGQVGPGDPLRIDELARTLGVSTTPVREGLLALSGEGFVAFEPRRGFKVVPLSAADVTDLYWAQAEIAAELAHRAAGASTAELVADLEAIGRRMREALDAGDPAAIEAGNHAFHRAINHAARAPKLTWLLRSVVRYAPRRFYATIPGWVEASLGDHSAIVDALRRGDGPLAARTMGEHIRHAGNLLVENLVRRGQA